MRITNKIMQNNQMYNINQNKIKEDKYATQMSTNKKIGRASEDPVIAIRALRLRSNVAELTQYYEKNSKDAESWLKVTEDALSTVTDLLTSAIAQSNKGANKELTTTDLSAIISEMTDLANEYYATGNVDYGGRYVFTGYRTDTPLTFTDKTSWEYTDIHDGFNAADIDDLVHISNASSVDPNGMGKGTGSLTESDIQKQEIGRIRLSYSRLEEDTTGATEEEKAKKTAESVELKYREAFQLPATSKIDSQYESGKPKEVTVTFTDGGTITSIKVTLPETVTDEGTDEKVYDGFTLKWNSDGTFRLESEETTDENGRATQQVINLAVNGAVHSSYRETTIPLESAVIMSTTADTDADAIYESAAAATEEKAWLNAATGEILLSEALKAKFTSLENINNADSIEVVYDKSQWEKGDIRPENLFECSSVTQSGRPVHYNGGTYGHTMGYDVGYNQVIDVNTQAKDVFTTDVRRTMDDLNSALSKLETLETTMAQIKEHMEADPSSEALKAEYAAAQKAHDYLRQDIQEQLEHKITQFQKALDVANLAVTQNGTRSRRLELIQNRLQNQVTTFETLQSDNEDIDMAETATNLMTAQTVYNAALQATGKISQQSLMDYI